MSEAWQVALGVLAGLLVAWLALVVALLVGRPGGRTLTAALRLLPDLLRLVARLARDRTLPRSLRVRLGLLVAYLAFPLDLIPDVVPVLGYADDVIVVVWVLRSVLRVAGEGPIRAHWPGTSEGCEAVLRIARSRRRGDGASAPAGSGP
ncbi:DUF1232 domain-containing protein [Cellulomonas iranensis]|uniref:YkvA family protein n=1 Tax=Cellulomonas iranensis TaxID=76862 RepID=UPI001CF22301|nr:YkvA family protein [Cellulomonas iranensis]UCN14791.1 DUF1232 domain-containing protein [Cellulomonas iranensis]